MKQKINSRGRHGFYLYELMIATTISGLLVVMVSVSFRGWWLPLQARLLQQELQSSLHSSALLAHQLGHKVQLCGINDNAKCDNNWSKGWKVMDGLTHEILSTHALSGRLSLIWSGSLGRPVRFATTGRPDGLQGGWRCRFDGRELFHLVLLRVM